MDLSLSCLDPSRMLYMLAGSRGQQQGGNAVFMLNRNMRVVVFLQPDKQLSARVF
jgi:hypothetical protein